MHTDLNNDALNATPRVLLATSARDSHRSCSDFFEFFGTAGSSVWAASLEYVNPPPSSPLLPSPRAIAPVLTARSYLYGWRRLHIWGVYIYIRIYSLAAHSGGFTRCETPRQPNHATTPPHTAWRHTYVCRYSFRECRCRSSNQVCHSQRLQVW